MLFIVGGAARSGKSIIAREYLRRTGTPYFSLDFLVMGLAAGAPRLGVRPECPSRANAEKLGPVLKAIGRNVVEAGVDYLFEGDTILPAHVRDLADAYPDQVKPVLSDTRMSGPM